MATMFQILQNALSTIDPRLPNETKRIHLKAALQALALDYIYNHAHYRGLNFYGGTCLHMIYNLNRLSEDIDLDNSQGIDLETLGEDLCGHFQAVWGCQAASYKQQESQGGILRVTLRFPVLFELGLSPHREEALHLKVEVSQHRQVAVIQRTPVIRLGRSFVPSHFSLETMMAGKMLACLERSFEVGSTGIAIKGRDYYDLLWFMEQRIQPLEAKLTRDGAESYSTRGAMLSLQEKVRKIRQRDLAVDLLPLFAQRTFIEAWIASFHENFERFSHQYL